MVEVVFASSFALMVVIPSTFTTQVWLHDETPHPHVGWMLWFMWGSLRLTSHTRLNARDQSTPSTLIGGKGGAGLSLLHTTLEGPMVYVNARWIKVHKYSYMTSNESCFMVA